MQVRIFLFTTIILFMAAIAKADTPWVWRCTSCGRTAETTDSLPPHRTCKYYAYGGQCNFVIVNSGTSGSSGTEAATPTSDPGAWVTHDGVATGGGVDNWTFIHTSVTAELKYKNGLASEFLVTNNDPKHSLYVSGDTGTNQFNSATKLTGREIKPGQTDSLPLPYQTQGHPLKKATFTYTYWSESGLPSSAKEDGDKYYFNSETKKLEPTAGASRKRDAEGTSGYTFNPVTKKFEKK